MPDYTPISGKLVWKLQKGYVDGKMKYIQPSLSIDPTVSHDDVAEVAEDLATLYAYPVDSVYVTTKQLVTI
jgi:hypothetical protein